MVGQAGHRVDALALAYRLEGDGWRGSEEGGKGRGPGSSHGLGRYRANSPAGYSLQSAMCNVQC